MFGDINFTQMVQVWNTNCLNILNKHSWGELWQVRGIFSGQVKFEELVAGSSLQRIAISVSYLKEGLLKTVLNSLFTIGTTCSNQTAVGGLNFYWVLKIEVHQIVLCQSRDLRGFLSNKIFPIITKLFWVDYSFLWTLKINYDVCLCF